MNFGVHSFSELYTTLIGWQYYQTLWNILTQTGIAYIPFLILFLTSIILPLTNHQPRTASLFSLRSVEVNFILMVLVITLAVQPIMVLKPNMLNFKPTCSNSLVRPGDTNTTYDKAFTELKNVKVPILWYALIAISQGITRAINVGLDCPLDLRQKHQQLQSLHVESPELKAELVEFKKHCWKTAQSRLIREKPDIAQWIHRYGYKDLQWIGSRIFQQLPGYYEKLSAPSPIKGFPFNPTRDFEQGHFQKWGTPNCKEWWSNSNEGIHTKLIKKIPENLYQWLTERYDREKASDAALQALITNSLNVHIKPTKWHQFVQTSTQIAPILQSILLAMIYIILPLLLVITNYRIIVVYYIGCLLLSIIFWRFWWYLATHLEDRFIKAFYNSELEFLTFPPMLDGKKLAVDIIIFVMYCRANASKLVV